jgi:hypothetical protein
MHLEELALLKGQIEGDGLRIRRLEEAANNWMRAKHIRDYVMVLIESKTKQGYRLVPQSALVKWAIWAMEQADRLDPRAEFPSSVLHRKGGDLRALSASVTCRNCTKYDVFT